VVAVVLVSFSPVVPRSGAGVFSSVLSCFIRWCFSLPVRSGEICLDKQKGRGSRMSGSAASERSCWLVA